MSHICRALILHCIDFRLQPDLEKFIASNSLVGDVDRVSIAGAVRPLVHGTEAEKAYVLGQIATSVQLHASREIYLVNHTDCGAYGGKTAFPTEAAEYDQHVADLNAAKQAFLAVHPDLTVKLVIARITEAGEARTIQFESVT